jgi:DNA-binding NtrC family response regulator
MVGASAVMQELFRTIRKVASVDAPVLIIGETGTGKELTARAIHRGSARVQGPFIAVNCGALPANLIQAELFGYERGAFTGAQQRTLGRIELAAGGVLFLDEIGDLAPELQVNLLRFLEEGTLERVGGRTPIAVNTRVMVATHVDLERAVKQRHFREDLYHRINVLRVHVPPLRDRGSDVIYLARLFLERYLPEVQHRGVRFTREAIDAMSRYPWPGNVRELTNRIHHAVVMCEGRWITPASLGLDEYVTESSSVTLTETRFRAEVESIRKALRDVGHNVSRAAHSLGVSRRTLYRRMKRYGLSADAPDEPSPARTPTK